MPLAVLMLLASSEVIVITHNGGQGLDRPDLRYADDDGLQYAALFRQAHVQVTLLTQLDRESAVLHPQAVPDGPPTREALFAAVQRARRSDEVYLIFAGHGDVHDGSGFLSLADGALSAAELDARVLTPLDGARVHLLIDSCNSYFMVMPRKPGGAAFRTRPPQGAFARHPKLNVLLSTSAEAVTYEWSELQSGIFSYVVRSALRGAADADADGVISYAEISAFVTVATQTIENDAYRPHVFSRSSHPILFKLPVDAANELTVDGPHRLTLRNEKGIRLADVHTVAPVRLWLPNERISVEERIGRRLVQREIGPNERKSLAALQELPHAMAERGESPVFRNLFAQPFSQAAVEQAASQPHEEAFGVSKAEVDRWRTVLRERVKAERAARNTAAWTLGIEAAAMFTAGVPMAIFGALQRNGPNLVTGVMVGGAGILTAAIGLPVLLARNTTSEELWREMSELRLDTETSRSMAVSRIALHMLDAQQRERRTQLVRGILGLTAAAAVGGVGGLLFAMSPVQTTPGVIYSALAGALFVNAIHNLLTLPAAVTSVDQITLDGPRVTFESISVGSDGQSVYGSAGLRF